MPTIKLKEGEHLESAIRRLKRLVEKSGIPKELRLRERFEKPSKKKQRCIAAAKKRLNKRIKKVTTPKKAHNNNRIKKY